MGILGGALNRRDFNRSLLMGAVGLTFAEGASAADSAPAKTITLGVLSDFSNVFSTSGGKGLVVAAKLAADDFLKANPDANFNVDVIYADHQQKADVGAAVAKQWYEQRNVDAILDVVNSAVAFAVVEETRKHNKVALISGAGSAQLTGTLCTPNSIHWTYDTWEVGHVVGKTITERGGKSWFFITADYSFGKDLATSTAAAIKQAGGSVIGEVKHPIGSQDFSSFLLQAQSSGAQVVGFANAGGDLVTSVKQAHEFGVTPTQQIAAINANIVDIKSLGLEEAQGITLAEPFYWDLDDSTRDWTHRFEAAYSTSYPTLHHAGIYAAVTHYLKAVNAVATSDGDKVVAQMKKIPTKDGLFSDGYVRQDGRVIHDVYVFKVTSPTESKSPWDLYQLIETIPGDKAFRPLADGACPIVI